MRLENNDICDRTGSETLQLILRPETASQVSGQMEVNYRHYDQQSNGTSCCRMAVSEEQQDKPKAENENTQTNIKVVPNPGQNQIEVQTNGEWVQFKIVDVKGRIVTEGNAFSGNLLLLTQQLPNGLYRVILSNQKESRSANFQILK